MSSPSVPAPVVALSEHLDRSLIRRIFSSSGRIHVPGIFSGAAATRIHQALSVETRWQLAVNSGDQHFGLSEEQINLLPSAQQVLLVEGAHSAATRSFQYIYNNFPIHDLHAQGQYQDHYLMRVYEYLNGAEFLEFAREVTGLAAITCADAQATLYRPGHFLSTHDDLHAGKQRLAAYVLNFTPHWRADWGGILQFIDEDEHVIEGYVPKFNALNLLRVPQKHCVSFVTPAATAGRYSITGWLRAT